MKLKISKKYALRLENKSYAYLIREGRNSRVHESSDIHHAFHLRSIDEAMEYTKAINENEKMFNKKRIFSDQKVVEVTEITYSPKVTKRIKLT